MKTTITFIILFLGITISSHAQNYKVDVEGDGEELIRVHSLPQNGGLAGIELLLGTSGGLGSGDWRIMNDGGKLQFVSNNNNFSSAGVARVAITRLGNFGIGTLYPDATLHLGDGEEASVSGDGYLLIGDKSATNMVFDENEINTRLNGGSSSLYLQRHRGNIYTGSGGGNIFLSQGGGNTYTGYTGGNTYLAYGGGKTSVGGTAVNAKFNITDDNFQLYLRNADGDVNDWYIGASSNGWNVGDDQLIFSPAPSSNAAVLRLNDVTDNNGTVAPVAIASSGGHQLLFDGNEIDANSPLFINHNTNQNTYINPTGGKASVGSSNPWGVFHAEYAGSNENQVVISMETPRCGWGIKPSNVVGNANLFFVPKGANAVSGISSVSGAYFTISDRRLKENIERLPTLMDKLNQVGLYSYTFKKDENDTPNIGVIAQELKEIFPEMISSIGEYNGVNYSQLTILALKGIQELSTENSELKTRLDEQETRFNNVAAQVEELMQASSK